MTHTAIVMDISGLTRIQSDVIAFRYQVTHHVLPADCLASA
jgi:hypothetical protein